MNESDLLYLKQPTLINGQTITAIRTNFKPSGELEVFHLHPDANGVLVSDHSDLLFDPRDQSDFWDWLASIGTMPPRKADQSLDDPALAQFFEDLADLDADRAENSGTPQYDNLGFEIGRKPDSDPRDL